MPTPRTLIALTALLAAAPLCLAQSESGQGQGDSQSASRKQYQVEVITFQYLGPDSSGTERFDRLRVEEYLPSGSFDIDEYNRIREAVSYTKVTRLDQAAARLEQNPYYSITSRAAWIQPLLSKTEAVAVPLDGDAPGNSSLQGNTGAPRTPGTSGTLSVYGDYLLFIELKMRAVLSNQPPARSLESSQADQQAGGDGFGAASREGTRVYQLSEKRRIKLDEIHYFDHPYIGAIVSVSRY